MSLIRIAAIVLLAAGMLGLAYGGFAYRQDTHRATIGPLQLQENKNVDVPVRTGIAATVLGAILLIVPKIG